MAQKTLLSNTPSAIAKIDLEVKEYMQYLYYPIKLPGEQTLQMEPRLQIFEGLIREVLFFEAVSERRDLQDKYIYLTVKNTFVPVNLHQNRPGWHSDGFGTEDVNYIWFDRTPTEFLIGDFKVSEDDTESMDQMEEYSKGSYGELFLAIPFHIYRLTENHIHRTTCSMKDGKRCFVKITISDHLYAQEGNSVNYDFTEKWDYSPRKIDRNQPHLKYNA